MYDFIEWNPEQVAECAKKCDAAGEIFSKSKLTSISTGAQHQEDLDELIQDINGLIAGLTLACAGVSQATTAVNIVAGSIVGGVLGGWLGGSIGDGSATFFNSYALSS